MSLWEDWAADGGQTAANFRLLFPEFARADTPTIESRIAWAEERTPADIWDATRPQGIAWMAAHFLCLLPSAKDMRKGEKAGETMYGRERQKLNRIVGGGFRVAGIPSTVTNVDEV